MIVSMKNEGGLTRQVKVGFSWTAFFFGPFPFLFRGMTLQFAIWLVVSVITLGISNLILMFIINKQTAQYYADNGYKPVGPGWEMAGPRWGIEMKGVSSD